MQIYICKSKHDRTTDVVKPIADEIENDDKGRAK